MKARDYVAFALGSLGLLHMAADLAGLTKFKAVLAATTLAPAPKVFSAINGFETFSNRFLLSFDSDGSERRTEVTANRYQRLEGPYNRRNVYGAALAYGPVLTQSERGKILFDAVARYAFCRPTGILTELGFHSSVRPQRITIEFESLNPRSTGSRRVEVHCQ